MSRSCLRFFTFVESLWSVCRSCLFNSLVMKKVCLFFVLCCAVALFSCDDVENTAEAELLLTSKSAQAIVEANNAFAFDFIKEHHQNVTEANYMISPVSLSLALGMAYNGADGTTKTAFEEMMHYQDLSIDINAFNQQLIAQLSSSDVASTMEIANSIWLNEFFPVKSSFLEINQLYYAAEVQNLDFLDSETLAVINAWVKEKTHEKIPSILSSIAPDAVMYLVNALYFNAQWKYGFDEENTEQGSFWVDNNERILVDKMKLSKHLPYASNDLFSSIILPYENEAYSMTLMLPRSAFSTDDIIDALGADAWQQWQAAYDTTREVTVALPRFKSSYEKYLNDELISLGLAEAFNASLADFSKISDVATYISFVLQKTFIDVNEKGTEAAAVTVIGFETTSIEEPQSIYFDLNRPFLYFITDKQTGSICFMGKVGEPVNEE